MKPLYAIQYLRAFAALAVVAFHTGLAGRVGQAGVDIFFVISGLIMWIVTDRERAPVSFFLRRVIRVWPLYFVATIIMSVHNRPHLIDIVKSILFIPYRNPNGYVWPILVQGWTLNYEMLFYLILSIALLFSRRIIPLFLTVVLVGLSVIGLAEKPDNALLSTFTSPILLEFLAGIWIGRCLTTKWFLGPRSGGVLVVLALLSFELSNFFITPDRLRFLVWGIPGIMLVCGALSLEVAGLVPVLKPMVTLGNSSYSIYLFHPFLQKTVLRLLAVFPSLAALGGLLIINAFLGVVIYAVVEKRLNSFGKLFVHAVESRFDQKPTEAELSLP